MNGDHFILYTTEQGGIFKAIRGTREQYDEAVETGTISIPANDKDDGSNYNIQGIYFIAFGRVEDNYDRGLGTSRELAAAGLCRRRFR